LKATFRSILTVVIIDRSRRWVAAVLLLGCSVPFASCSGPRELYPSPDGEREAVVELGRTALENLWTVSVSEDRLFGDDQVLGCFTDDDPDSGTPTDVTWSNADSLVIRTTTTEVRVELNANLSARGIEQGSDDFLAPCPYS
jgi:hypothetical protein